MIMETEKSRPRRTNDRFPVQVQSPEDQESWWRECQYKSQSNVRTRPMSQLEDSQAESLRSGLEDHTEDFGWSWTPYIFWVRKSELSWRLFSFRWWWVALSPCRIPVSMWELQLECAGPDSLRSWKQAALGVCPGWHQCLAGTWCAGGVWATPDFISFLSCLLQDTACCDTAGNSKWACAPWGCPAPMFIAHMAWDHHLLRCIRILGGEF